MVIRSKVTFRFWIDGPAGADPDPCDVSLRVHDVDECSGDSYGQREVVGTKNTTVIKPITMHTLSATFSNKRHMDYSTISADRYGTAGSNPNVSRWFVLTFTDREGFNSWLENDLIETIHWDAKVTYYAKWVDRKIIAAS
jgi:hypothetical protein